jgi:WS/DGAT/MGAT family acyltransferase
MRQPLSAVETIMWRVGGDATLRTTIGNLLVLNEPPDRAALSERLAATAGSAVRLRRRPVAALLPSGRPVWDSPATFDAEDHIRDMEVASPGEPRQVLDLVTLLEATPFDPDRPPWDVTLIRGLEGGRAAIYLRAHHVLTDGFGGLSLLDLLLDQPAASIAATPPSAPYTDDTAGDTAGDGAAGAAPTVGGRRPGTVTVSFDLANAWRPAVAGVNAALQVDPRDTVVRHLRRGFSVAGSLSRQVLASSSRRAPLPPSRAPVSRFEILSVPGARAAALSFGGSRNDLVVAAAATALGRYLERLGQPTDELRLAAPVRRRHKGGGPDNSFAPVLVDVPARSTHPGPHFGVVAERLHKARREPVLQVAAALAPTISRLPSLVLTPALHAQAHGIDFVATALPGLRGTHRLCGAVVEESYPFGPRLGCPMNVTAFGNDGRLDVGVTLSPTAIAEPEVLLECLTQAFAELTRPSAPASVAPEAGAD